MSVVASCALARAFIVALAFLPLVAGSASALDILLTEQSFKVAALEPKQEHLPYKKAAAQTEPFGLFTREAPQGGASVKWQITRSNLQVDMRIVALCRAEPDLCPSPAAQKFIEIVDLARTREGRAQIGELNRAINFAIRPAADTAQHGVLDVWSSPLSTLSSGRGDCEDYAILKFAALRELGFAEDDLRLLIVREQASRDHAVVSVRLDGRWLILDNRRLTLVEDIHLRARPLFALSSEGAKIFTPDTTPLAAVEKSDAAGSWAAAPILM